MNGVKSRNYSFEIWVNVGSICLHPSHAKFYSLGIIRALQGISSEIRCICRRKKEFCDCQNDELFIA